MGKKKVDTTCQAKIRIYDLLEVKCTRKAAHKGAHKHSSVPEDSAVKFSISFARDARELCVSCDELHIPDDKCNVCGGVLCQDCVYSNNRDISQLPSPKGKGLSGDR
jgi:hypothetical protein